MHENAKICTRSLVEICVIMDAICIHDRTILASQHHGCLCVSVCGERMCCCECHFNFKLCQACVTSNDFFDLLRYF